MKWVYNMFQSANLNFPDKYSLKCEHCELQISLTQPLPSAHELATYFTKIFISHTDRECSETPSLVPQDADKLFLRCDRCEFDFKIF